MNRRIGAVALAIFAVLLFTQPAKAARYGLVPEGSLLLAQSEGDDAYDPFADYSEFEESMEEEEDINFFRNGRLFTMGFLVGYRSWSGNLNGIYSSDPNFGLYLSYFFDLRFALQFGFLTGSHALSASAANGQTVQGNVALTDISFNFKYYMNTQNVTRGLASLNPYVLAGFSQVLRTVAAEGQAEANAKDSAFAFNAGGGIEIPMMRNKMYFGLQGMYQLVNFADENRYIMGADTTTRIIKPSGDSWNAVAILGVNF